MKAGAVDTVVVLTALELEYEAVRAHLIEPQPWQHPAGTVFEVGIPSGCSVRIVIALAGPGNDKAAVLAERAIAPFEPRAVLFVGVAGALHDDLHLGDVVVATKVYGYHAGTEEAAGFLARPRASDASHELYELARLVSRDRRWTELLSTDNGGRRQVHFRPIAAGEVVLNSRITPLAQQLREHYNDAAAVEMESAGFARAAHLNKSVQALTIRAISDKADGTKRSANDTRWQPAAAANAAAFAISLTRAISNASKLSMSSPTTMRRPVIGPRFILRGRPKTFWITVAATLIIVAGVVLWLVIYPSGGTERTIRLTAGVSLRISDLYTGDYLPDGDVELHPRSALGDQFTLLPLGYAHIALAPPHPTKATCVDILNHGNDQYLVVSRLGSVDGANAKPGDWVCVRENVDQQTVAALDIQSLTNDLPGSLGLGVTTW